MSARELFDKFDRNGNGSITCGEVEEVLRALGVSGDCKAMIRAVDANSDGTIDWEEFQEMMRSSSGLGGIIKEKRNSILNVRTGAGNAQHTFSREETEAFKAAGVSAAAFGKDLGVPLALCGFKASELRAATWSTAYRRARSTNSAVSWPTCAPAVCPRLPQSISGAHRRVVNDETP